MNLAFIKTVHLTSVAISYALFFLRGLWTLRNEPDMRQGWTKLVPHVVDSMLLSSAIVLALRLGLSPLSSPWFAAKMSALLTYIMLGSLALRHARTPKMRLTAWLAAQGVFFYMAGVALTHDALPWRALG